MLKDTDRNKLDGIVSQMEKNGEKPEDIQFVVDDFKAKYDTQESAPTAEKPKSVIENIVPAWSASRDKTDAFLPHIVAGVGDVFTAIPRGVSAAATGLGSLAGGADAGTAGREALRELGKTKSGEKGALGFAQSVALDPTTYLPAGKLLKGAKVLSKAPALVKEAIIAGVEGAKQGGASAAYQQAQEGKVDAGEAAIQAGKGFALGGGLPVVGGIAGKGVGAIGSLAKKGAARNVAIELRPGQYGTNRGFSAENAVKYDLIGKPREIADKSQELLSGLQKRAKEIGSESTEKINIQSILDKARAKFSRDKNVHDYDRVQGFIDDLEKTYQKAYENPDISLSDAMALRSQVGEKSAFVGARDRGGMTADPDADWKEKVFNSIYDDLKNEVHAKGGKELQAINRQQSEIIPIRQVALRRMPIAESNLRAGLMDAGSVGIGLGAGALASGSEGDRSRNAILGALALAGGRRAVGSKAATRAMYRIGEKLAPTLEKPLKNLNPADYPTGVPWRNVENSAPEDAFPGFGGLMTKKEYQAKKALELAGDVDDPDLFNEYNPNELVSKQVANQNYDDAMMAKSESVPVVDPKREKTRLLTLNSLKNQYGFGAGKEVPPFSKMKTSIAETIRAEVHQINTNPDVWNHYHEKGLLDTPWNPAWTEGKNEAAITPDDLRMWMNEAGKRQQIHNESKQPSKLSAFGESIKKSIGNERGAVGLQ